MAEFIRSNILDAHTMATEVLTEDLPVTPISHLVITMEGHCITDEATIAELLAFINSVAILHHGVQIINLESEDLAALNLYLFGTAGLSNNPHFGTTTYLSYSLIVPFGRTLFNPEECFPATRRGEFQIVLDTTIPAGSWQGGLISLSAVSLPEATPARHLKATLLSVAAPGATGENDVILPIGNDLLACLIGMTSMGGDADELWGVDDARVLFDNKELGIVSAKAPELAGEMMTRVAGTVRAIPAQADIIPAKYLWMDFDPTRDGQYMIDTRAAARLKLRLNMGVNEALNIVPVELVTV
jgi:hypothetical protein